MGESREPEDMLDLLRAAYDRVLKVYADARFDRPELGGMHTALLLRAGIVEERARLNGADWEAVSRLNKIAEEIEHG